MLVILALKVYWSDNVNCPAAKMLPSFNPARTHHWVRNGYCIINNLLFSTHFKIHGLNIDTQLQFTFRWLQFIESLSCEKVSLPSVNVAIVSLFLTDFYARASLTGVRLMCKLRSYPSVFFQTIYWKWGITNKAEPNRSYMNELTTLPNQMIVNWVITKRDSTTSVR